MNSALTLLLSLVCAGLAALLLASLCIARWRARDLERLGELLDETSTHAHSHEKRTLLPDFLQRRCLRAGWDPTQQQLMIALGAAAALIVAIAALAGAVAAVLAAITLPLAAFAILEWRGNRNMAQLGECMLGLLERIRQLLSVGHSLQTALQRAVDNSPPVVGRALAGALRRINNGAGVADSIERAAAELDIYELHMLATAARANLRFGGAMGATLKNMIETIRRRAGVERELRGNTTQIRASAWVLALLPLVVAGVVMTTNHNYARWFLATPAGHHMIVYAALSQALGIAAMRAITRARY